MPTMKQTPYKAEVVWLGVVPKDSGSLRANAVDRIEFEFGGVAGERHEGVTRPSCVRMSNLYPKGTEIQNVRQLSILAAEELDAIAQALGLETLDPSLLGASLVVRGIPDFTHIPPSARLQGPSGVTLTTDTENRPCVYPAKEIEKDRPGHGKAFLSAAKDLRGVTAWVECPGPLAVGDVMTFFVPDQRGWDPES